jgi:hypothetical protein
MTPARGVVGGLLLSLVARAGATEGYSIEDLEALAGRGGWLELAEHAGDIPPARRNQQWQGLLQRTELALLDSAEKQEAPLDRLRLCETLIERFPELSRSREVMARRAEVGPKVFARCMQAAAEDCLRGLATFVGRDERNPDLAARAGKVARRAGNAAALPFFAHAVAAETAPGPRQALCADEDLGIAVLHGLGLSPSAAGELVASSRSIAQTCISALAPALREELQRKTAPDYASEAICALLRPRNAIPAEARKVCSGAR